jgi:hypothetical protein
MGNIKSSLGSSITNSVKELYFRKQRMTPKYLTVSHLGLDLFN